MKMLRSLVVVSAAATMLALGACHGGQKDAGASAGLMNSKCPFSGEAVDANVTTDYQGGKVGFCCNGCKGEWEKAGDDAKAAMLKKAK